MAAEKLFAAKLDRRFFCAGAVVKTLLSFFTEISNLAFGDAAFGTTIPEV